MVLPHKPQTHCHFLPPSTPKSALPIQSRMCAPCVVADIIVATFF